MDFYLCIISGKCRVCIFGDLHTGSRHEDHSLWISISPWCLPPQWMEHFRFSYCSNRVSYGFLSSIAFMPHGKVLRDNHIVHYYLILHLDKGFKLYVKKSSNPEIHYLAIHVSLWLNDGISR